MQEKGLTYLPLCLRVVFDEVIGRHIDPVLLRHARVRKALVRARVVEASRTHVERVCVLVVFRDLLITGESARGEEREGGEGGEGSKGERGER